MIGAVAERLGKLLLLDVEVRPGRRCLLAHRAAVHLWSRLIHWAVPPACAAQEIDEAVPGDRGQESWDLLRFLVLDAPLLNNDSLKQI